MNRLLRRCVWVTVLVVFVAAMVTFFGWATSGFRNWDSATWFNYWGKGKPVKVVKVVEPAAEQRVMALTSADDDNTLTHDSDDASITFELTKLPVPSYEWQSDGLHVWTEGIHVKDGNLTIQGCFYNGLFTIHKYTYSTSGSDKSEEFCLPYDVIDRLVGERLRVNYDYSTNSPHGICLNNSSAGNYLASDRVVIPLFKSFGSYQLSATMEGTQITFKNMGVFDTEEPFENDTSFVFRSGCKINITGSNGKTCNYSFDSNPNNFVTLTDGFYSVDLTKLTFIEDVVDVVTVEIVPYLTATSDTKTINYRFFGWLNPIYFSIAKLAAPTALNYSAGTLTWNEVEGANGYGVFWTDKCNDSRFVIVDEPTYNFDVDELGAGDNVFRVRALGNIGETLATAENSVMTLSAFNASSTVTQLVTLTYNVNGETITKFVPLGSKLADYIYEVKVSGKEFGGWYYDDGFSVPIVSTDVLSGDTTIYARLSDKKVTERKLTWWDEYHWYVYGALIAIAVLGIAAGVVVGIRKKKAA